MFRSKKCTKKALIYVLAVVFLLVNINFTAFAADTNIALLGTPSTSFCSSWETLTAINDGYTPANSADNSYGAYGNWDNPGTTQWVQYDLAQNYTISKCEVYWFDDDQGLDLPESCSIQYWNGSAWVNVENPVGLGVVGNTFNVTTFTEVSTNRIRLNMTAKDSYSTGILEWRVWGSPVTSSNDVVAYYKFDSNTSDSSGNGSNAILSGTTSYVAGKTGNALDLDGTSGYASMPSGIVSSLNDFTIAAWVNIDTASSWARIFDIGLSTSAYMFLTPNSGSDTVRFAIKNGGSEQQINSTSALDAGVWKHVAVTLSGSTGILYIDGVEVGRNTSISINPSSLGSTTNNYIGKSQYSDPYLDGQIDEFKIYNRALSLAEIQALVGTTTTNTAPVVNAGSDASITLPSSATLAGTVTDDGLPSGATVTSTWSQLSGSGTVTFANPNSPSTTATFTAAGTYVLQLTASDTELSSSDTVTITVSSETSSGSYVWNYGDVPSATIEAWNDDPTLTPININPYGTPSLTIPYGYILLSEGPNGTSQVSVATQTSILQRINEDLKWETETLGIHMPPWSTGETGTKYIDYFFTNTGLPNDPGATGDQAWEGSYPFVETDSNGMSDQNRYNLTHEFNHVLLNAYGTVPGDSVSWVQESLNNYMILRLAEWRSGATIGQSQQFEFPSGIGYLDATVYNQPYVPIESCGINSSGEATGPSDYYNDSTGFRYNELFPLFVSQRVGVTFYAKVFEDAYTSEQNLQTMTRLLDKERVQSMVTEYAARLALGDFMEFSDSIQGLASTSMYAATTDQNGWLVPSDNNKLPRYTGRNNIPISVNSEATEVTVNFVPDSEGSNGTTADMRCQIAYRATDGTTVFSTPVSSGETTIELTKTPKNGVVTVVISNVTMSGYKNDTSYGWDPTEKFGYKIKVTGGTAAATNTLYF